MASSLLLGQIDSDSEVISNFDVTLNDDDIQALLRKAKIKVYSRLAESYYTRKFYETGIIDIRDSNPEEMTKILNKEFERNVTKPPYWLVTVNPRPGTTLDDLQKYVKKFVGKKTIKRFFYVYEVRKSDFSGLHWHCLVETTNKPYEFKIGTQNTFKNICDAKNSHILNFKNLADTVLEDKVNYMKGAKKESKESGYLASVEFRKEYYLEPFYESGIPFTCRDTQKI